MMKYRYEYRINKKGAECFRTEFYEEARAKFEELRTAKPNVRYDMQRRHVVYDHKGRPMYDGYSLDGLQWSLWEDATPLDRSTNDKQKGQG